MKIRAAFRPPLFALCFRPARAGPYVFLPFTFDLSPLTFELIFSALCDYLTSFQYRNFAFVADVLLLKAL